MSSFDVYIRYRIPLCLNDSDDSHLLNPDREKGVWTAEFENLSRQIIMVFFSKTCVFGQDWTAESENLSRPDCNGVSIQKMSFLDSK